MNYLTAIIAFPLFNILFAFECWLIYTNRQNIIKNGKGIIASCIVVSFLQMVSCWFWFLGFNQSTLDNVFSEGMNDETEHMNCFGLVGAEVLLAIFQCIFTMQTAYSCWTMRNVYVGSVLNKSTAVRTMSVPEQVAAWIGGTLLVLYTGLAFVTAQNRRCQQGNHYWMVIQHHFYPIYLGLDVIFSTITWYYCNKIVQSIDNHAARASVLSNGSDSVYAGKPTTIGGGPVRTSVVSGGSTTMAGAVSKSTLRLMQDLANFYWKQTILSIVGGFFAVTIFIIQFVAHWAPLRLIACIFCVCMYVIYACRRVPIEIMYTKWGGWRIWLKCCFPVAAGTVADDVEGHPSKDSNHTSGHSSLPSPKRASLPMTAFPTSQVPTQKATPQPTHSLSGGEFSAISITENQPPISPSNASVTALRSPLPVSPMPVGGVTAQYPASTGTTPNDSLIGAGAAASPRQIRLHIHPSTDLNQAPQLAATINKIKTNSTPLTSSLGENQV